MDKINNSAIMKVNVEKTATTYTRDRLPNDKVKKHFANSLIIAISKIFQSWDTYPLNSKEHFNINYSTKTKYN